MERTASARHRVDLLKAWSRIGTWAVLAGVCLALVAFDRTVFQVGTGPLHIPLIALAVWRLGPREACAVAFGAALLNIVPHHGGDAALGPILAAVRGVTRLRADGFVVAVCALWQAYDRERKAARRDALTGAPNRAVFEEHARTRLDGRSERGPVRVLALADINGFKAVNDVERHAAGDDVLCMFGGYVKPANWRENRVDRRLAKNQTGKRRVVIVMRERGGRTLPFVVRHEVQSVETLEKRIKPGSIVHADEARSWDALYYVGIDVKRINHQEAYSDGEACTNNAETFFSRIRRAEIGMHHHIEGPYLADYANEMAWREDARRINNGEQFLLIGLAALIHPPSTRWKGYWQRAKRKEAA